MKKYFYTSESVTEGHPDKLCDAISDAVLDACLEQDPMSRVACEAACSTGFVMVMGEITTKANIDIIQIARDTLIQKGYNDSNVGIDGNNCAVFCSIDKQSSDIALGVDNSFENKLYEKDLNDQIGAGDQGMMFGYACKETETLMPYAIYMANKLTYKLSELRKNGVIRYLRPDGKAQVCVEYRDDKPYRIDSVVVSTQHSKDVDIEILRKDIKELVVLDVLPKNMIDANTQIFINPTGRFVIGGPHGDSGLTGRKIIADTYGGYCPHGGGAFSGKDPTKVDRSAAYMARYIAKNLVASGFAEKCQIMLAYAIGAAKPLTVQVKTFGTSVIEEEEISEIVKKVFDLRPKAIIDTLKLRNPIYKNTTNYGHFGKNDLPWERLDRVEELKSYIAK